MAQEEDIALLREKLTALLRRLKVTDAEADTYAGSIIGAKKKPSRTCLRAVAKWFWEDCNNGADLCAKLADRIDSETWLKDTPNEVRKVIARDEAAGRSFLDIAEALARVALYGEQCFPGGKNLERTMASVIVPAFQQSTGKGGGKEGKEQAVPPQEMGMKGGKDSIGCTKDGGGKAIGGKDGSGKDAGEEVKRGEGDKSFEEILASKGMKMGPKGEVCRIEGKFGAKDGKGKKDGFPGDVLQTTGAGSKAHGAGKGGKTDGKNMYGKDHGKKGGAKGGGKDRSQIRPVDRGITLDSKDQKRKELQQALLKCLSDTQMQKIWIKFDEDGSGGKDTLENIIGRKEDKGIWDIIRRSIPEQLSKAVAGGRQGRTQKLREPCVLEMCQKVLDKCANALSAERSALLKTPLQAQDWTSPWRPFFLACLTFAEKLPQSSGVSVENKRTDCERWIEKFVAPGGELWVGTGNVAKALRSLLSFCLARVSIYTTEELGGASTEREPKAIESFSSAFKERRRIWRKEVEERAEKQKEQIELEAEDTTMRMEVEDASGSAQTPVAEALPQKPADPVASSMRMYYQEVLEDVYEGDGRRGLSGLDSGELLKFCDLVVRAYFEAEHAETKRSGVSSMTRRELQLHKKGELQREAVTTFVEALERRPLRATVKGLEERERRILQARLSESKFLRVREGLDTFRTFEKLRDCVDNRAKIDKKRIGVMLSFDSFEDGRASSAEEATALMPFWIFRLLNSMATQHRRSLPEVGEKRAPLDETIRQWRKLYFRSSFHEWRGSQITQLERRMALLNRSNKPKRCFEEKLSIYSYCEDIFCCCCGSYDGTGLPDRRALALLCFVGWMYYAPDLAEQVDYDVECKELSALVGEGESYDSVVYDRIWNIISLELCADSPSETLSAQDGPSSLAAAANLREFFKEFHGFDRERSEMIPDTEDPRRRRVEEVERTDLRSELPTAASTNDLPDCWLDDARKIFAKRLGKDDFKPEHHEFVEAALREVFYRNGNQMKSPGRPGVHNQNTALLLGPWWHIGTAKRKSGLKVTKATEEMPNLYTILGLVRPQECDNINVIVNFGIKTKVHVDGLNKQESWIVSYGNFDFSEHKRGDLWIRSTAHGDQDRKHRMICPENKKLQALKYKAGEELPGKVVNIKRTWFRFDAREVHSTLGTKAGKYTDIETAEERDDRRCCLIYFSHQRSRKVMKEMVGNRQDNEEDLEHGTDRIEAEKTKVFMKDKGWIDERW
ncbi:unnamed protein product [Amoebophrya sp. A25]|nr:unnamed protein product [Amoebophrya sp. A25]|eukprot:GSA25T00016337001.1